MRTMAVFVYFSVVVACSMREVFAISCSSVNLEDITNCNDCARCGGYWCNKPDQKDAPHCASTRTDLWCPGKNNIEELPSVSEESAAGDLIAPNFYTVTAHVGRHSPRIPFIYSLDSQREPNVHLAVINSTQTTNYEIVEKQTKCKNGKCTTHISIKPETRFCLSNSGKYEYLNVRVSVENVTEDAVVKYHVPCACQCSDHVEKKSAVCNGRGDLSCGVCQCHKGWTGEFCQNKPKCDHRRGDLQCTNPYKNHVECSGNGYCGPCDTCICYDDKEGAQYFDEANFCADLGMIVTNECESCLHEVPEGKCEDCSATIQPCNETMLSETDDVGRRVWVRFEDSYDSAEYAAMRDEEGHIHIMRISACNSIKGAIAGGAVNVTLPTVLGVIALVAAAAAAGGYAVWRARAPPAALAPHYTELDGPEHSAGINPLYKSPTSSYNNPTWKGGAKV